MKKLLTLLTVTLFLSCAQPQKKESQEVAKKVDYIYEATYSDNFKIGNPDIVLKVQEIHQYIINKNYDIAVSYLADNVIFALEDGSQLEGKEACMKFMLESYSSIEIEDYQVAVNLAVKEENGDEWVLLWDNGKIVTSDGKESAYNWMETFRFEGDKIAYMNQFSKPRK
tara:strand:+ start:865 stop:1371 length:507 start_codon:yes stop_codon:yes gene_type:complete